MRRSETLAELGGSADKVTTRECALNGLPSAITKAQAEAELKIVAEQNKTITAEQNLEAEKLAKQLLEAQEDSIKQQKAAVDSQLEAERQSKLLIEKTAQL